MNNGVDPGIIMLLGVMYSALVLAFTGIVDMIVKWLKLPKGLSKFGAGLIVAVLAFVWIICLLGQQ